MIDDEIPPIVSIAAENGGVAESAGTATFDLTATGLSATTTLMVKATATEAGGDFLTKEVEGETNSYPVEFTDSDNDDVYTGELPIPLHNDEVGEPTADIKVTLAENPLVYELGSTTAGLITIWDNETPELRITAVTPTITEAESITADFKVSAFVSPNDNVVVQYSIAESGSFVNNISSYKSASLNFTNQGLEDTISIAIASDTDTEVNGTITLTLTADTASPTKYIVATSPNDSAVVNVVDDDSLPVISILANSGTAAENSETAPFKLTATGLTETTTLSINATPAEDSHDFLTTTIADTAADFEVEFTDSDDDDTYEGELSVALDNDTTGEATGTIKLTLNTDPDSGKTYRLGTTTEGMITIYDDDAPELKITAGAQVVEAIGAAVDFTVSVEASPNRNVAVKYTLAESQTFIDGEGANKPANLDFTNNATEATLSIPLTSDTDPESNGTVTVTLTADTEDPVTYMVASSPNDTAFVNVIDDDSLPIVSILPDSGEAIEGPLAVPFKLTATRITGQQRIVVIKATPSEVSDDFLRDQDQDNQALSQVTFTDPDGDGTYEANYTQRLHNDSIGEATGDIKLNLNPNSGVYILGSVTEGVLTILDDDAPELEITAGDPVAEGENVFANFVVSAEVSPNKEVTVRYELEESTVESGDFVASDQEGDDKTANLDFRNGVKEATIAIPLTSDTEIEPNSTITVTLLADNMDPFTYTVKAAPDNIATMSVIDDDSLPLIEIAADSGEVAESVGFATFNLSATELSQNDSLTIYVTPTEQGSDFLLDRQQDRLAGFIVNFSDPDNDNIYTGNMVIPLHNDLIGETTGDIKATLNANPTEYRLGTTTEGLITIWDDDAPELKISTGHPITEVMNLNADFIVTALASPNKNLDVRYNLAETGNFVEIENEGNGKSGSLDFTNSKTEATLSIPITSDNVEEVDGTITVTLIADNSDPVTYMLASSENLTAVQTIYDDDSPPKVSVVAENGSTRENLGEATFSLTATGINRSTLSLFVNATANEVEDSDDFLTDLIENVARTDSIQFTDPDGDSTYHSEFNVPLHNDNVGEASGQLKLTLNEDPETTDTYRLGQTTEGFITILDDDVPELRITNASPVIEDRDATADFMVTASFSPNKEITVRYDLAESHDFLSNEGTDKTGTLDFTNGATEATLAIALDNDNTVETAGTITVTLTADTADPITYTVATSPNDSAVGNVSDNDNLPLIAIAADSGEAIESTGTAQFNLTATGFTATTTLMINATPAEDGGDFLTNAVTTATDFPVEFSDPDGDNTYEGVISIRS